MVEAVKREGPPPAGYMDEILPGLWLGPKWATNYKKAFEKIGITHILSMGEEPM